MVRVCTDWFKNEKNPKKDGFYMDNLLQANLDVLLKNAGKKDDWDFLVLITAGGGVRVGKCQPKGSKVLMSNGKWKNVEDVKIGDKVISPDLNKKTYTYSKVIETDSYFSEDNYSIYNRHYNKKLYSCSGNHLIPVRLLKSIRKTINGKRKIVGYKNEVKNMMASELYKKSDQWFRHNNTSTFVGYHIDKFEGCENPDIEPYTLGYFLGDGHFSDYVKYKDNAKRDIFVRPYKKTMKSGKVSLVKGFYKNLKAIDRLRYWTRHIGITTAESEVIEYVSKFYPIMNKNSKKNNLASTYSFSINSNLSKELIKLKLNGCNSGTKFIPTCVKEADANYRMKVLAGLIDSDGYVNKDGYISITTKSDRLAKDICELCKGLGGNSNIRKVRKGITGTDFIGNYFRVGVNLRERQKDIPLLNRFKKLRLKNLSFNFGDRFYIKEKNLVKFMD